MSTLDYLFYVRVKLTCSVLFSGDWAGAVWGSSGTPGQEQSCAQRTGVATCQQFVQQNGSAFADACKLLSAHYSVFHWMINMFLADWEVSYVQIYQTS